MKKAIKYDPLKSIDQMASANKVSKATIRKYVRDHRIDRCFDEKYRLFTMIKHLMKQVPDIKPSQIAKETHISLNTVKKYMKMQDIPCHLKDSKISAFDQTKSINNIKSVSSSQTEILRNILQLFIKSDHFQCDFTYSKGVFWQQIEEPELKFDKYPQTDSVLSLDQAYNLIQDGTLRNCVLDLPFIVHVGTPSIMIDRFTCFETVEDMYEANRKMIELSFRKLRKGGFLIMKTQDVSYSLQQLWVSDYVIQYAQKSGFQLMDKYILIANKRPLRGGRQHFARKFHSFFLVFKKK